MRGIALDYANPFQKKNNCSLRENDNKGSRSQLQSFIVRLPLSELSDRSLLVRLRVPTSLASYSFQITMRVAVASDNIFTRMRRVQGFADRDKYMSRWVRSRNHDILGFPRQAVIFGISRNKSQYFRFQISAMNRDFCKRTFPCYC